MPFKVPVGTIGFHYNFPGPGNSELIGYGDHGIFFLCMHVLHNTLESTEIGPLMAAKQPRCSHSATTSLISLYSGTII